MGKRWIYGGLARIGGGAIRVGGKKARVWGVGKFAADFSRFQIDMGNLIGRLKGAFFIAL